MCKLKGLGSTMRLLTNISSYFSSTPSTLGTVNNLRQQLEVSVYILGKAKMMSTLRGAKSALIREVVREIQ